MFAFQQTQLERPTSIGAGLRMIATDLKTEGVLRLNIYGSTNPPDPDGNLSGIDLIPLARGVEFVLRRGRFENASAFTVVLTPDELLPPFVVLRTEEGLPVAAGQLSAAQGTFDRHRLRAAEAVVHIHLQRGGRSSPPAHARCA